MTDEIRGVRPLLGHFSCCTKEKHKRGKEPSTRSLGVSHFSCLSCQKCPGIERTQEMHKKKKFNTNHVTAIQLQYFITSYYCSAEEV